MKINLYRKPRLVIWTSLTLTKCVIETFERLVFFSNNIIMVHDFRVHALEYNHFLSSTVYFTDRNILVNFFREVIYPHTWPERILRSKSSKKRTL